MARRAPSGEAGQASYQGLRQTQMKVLLATQLQLDEQDAAILRELRYDFPNYVIFKGLFDNLDLTATDIWMRLLHFKKHKMVDNGSGWRITAKGLGALHEYEVDQRG
jgi:hypothetical protein